MIRVQLRKCRSAFTRVSRSALRRLVVLPLVLVLTAGVAFAYWSADSAPGGGGASAAASVNQGETPTAVSAGSDVSVDWAASTLSNGDPVAGYLIKRYAATNLTLQTILTACSGTVTATSCIENGVPAGRWVYSVTPVLASFWQGAESPKSAEVTSDSTAPVNAISVSASAGDVYKSGTSIYYRGVAAGSFTLTNAVTDSGSGPASSATDNLGGSSTGWAHTASTVSAPLGGPYVSNPFSWSAGTVSGPTETVTGRDVAGNTGATTLSFVDDSTSPTAGTVTYPDGYQPGQSVVVTFASGTDAGAGIATRQLQRASADLGAGSCGTFTGFVDVGPEGATSPYTDSAVADAACYRYRYVVADRVGNRDIATTANVAMLDSGGGGPALRSAGAFSVLAGTSVASSGSTNVSGDLGVSPGVAVSGFPPGTVGGSIHINDSVALQAQADLHSAYADAAARTADADFAGDLNGRTFHAGVYHSAAAVAVTGTVTLDADNDPNAIFVFQIDAAMNPAASSQVNLINGAQASHVFWQVNGAVTTGDSAVFAGTILASGAITLGASTQLIGRALAYGTVTLAGSTIRFTTALPPTVTIDGGATAVTKDTTPAITGTTDAVPGTAVTVRVAGQVLTTSVQSGGTWTVTATALTAGSHDVVASVRDAAGNAGSATQALTVEVNPEPVVLGSAGTFSVLAGTAIASTGATNLSGDIGVSPGSAITGFPPGTVGGDTHTNDSAAIQAQADLHSAYAGAAGRTADRDVPADLAGLTLHAGVYHSAAALALTGTVTLDGENDPNATFIFVLDAALGTAAASHVNLINGAQASHVFWQVNGAVTTGGASFFAGTIMANGAITLGAGTEVIGRALAYGTVNLPGSTIRFTTALPPVVTIDGGATAVTKDTTPAITGTTDAVPGTAVTVRVAGQVLTTSVQSGGTWTVTAAALTAGSHDVLASVRDAAGNAGSATQALTVEVNPDPVELQSAGSFSVLAGTSVASSGSTYVTGDIGVSPGSAITGFPPGSFGGATHTNDSVAIQAQADLHNAYTEAAGRTPDRDFSGDQIGQTFHAGVYHTVAAFALTGDMTLDGENDPNAIFVFQVDAAMNTAASSRVLLVNGAQASHVFWQVAGAVGTGDSATLAGTIMANGAITLGASTALTGRALSYSTVTLTDDTITTN